MFAAKILTFLAAAGTVSAQPNTSKITHECMQTSQEYGDPEVSGIQIKKVSNMDNIVDIGDKSLFMRTSEILICSDDDYIHGMAVALDHDMEKDPAHNQFLDTFYSQDAGQPDFDKTFFEDLIGVDTGECEIVDVPQGERIEAVMVYHSDGAIRNLQFKLSDGTYQLVGTNQVEPGKVKQEVVNFANGEEILGFYGKMDNRNDPDWDEEGSPDHFVSIGFIVNRCDNLQMSQFSSQIGKSGPSAMASNVDPIVMGLAIGVAVLGLIVFALCTYMCLKNRGQICKKSAGKDAHQPELAGFDSAVSTNNLHADSTTKFKKPRHLVPQDSISSVSMVNPCPAAVDDSVINNSPAAFRQSAVEPNSADKDNQA